MVKLDKNIFKPIPKPKLTTQGIAGYDNTRENIDPHIKTQALSTKQIALVGQTINNSNGDLIIQNNNENKDIIFSINDGGIQKDFIKINSDVPILKIDSGEVTNDITGLEITGDITTNIVGTTCWFHPNYSDTGILSTGFFVNPTISAAGNAQLAGVYNFFETNSSQSSGTQILYGIYNQLTSKNTGNTTTYGTYTDMPSITQFGGVTTNVYGEYINQNAHVVLGGTLNKYGIYFPFSVFVLAGGAGETFDICSVSSSNWTLRGDNKKIFWGGAEDCSIYYDATNMVFDSQETGTGEFHMKNGDVHMEADTYWTGDGSGIPYGHMYTNDTIAVTIGSINTPTEIGATWTGGQVNLVTFGDDHYLAVNKAGRYKIDWSMSLSQNAPSAAIQAEQGIMINGTASNLGRAHRTIANTTDIGASCSNAIIDLAANDQISLYIENQSSTTNIDVEHANLTITMIGGT